MFTIRVRDFQSIRDASIEVSGLTVVTGPNNSGKSALVRAIQGAFTNPRGHRHVRHGADYSSVELVFGDGRSLTWEKGARDNRYALDGKVLERVGSGPPVELTSLGVVPVAAAGREIWPQFAPQFTGQVFLLDEPGSILAEAIADVDRVGVLNEALRLSQSDRRQLASELKVRTLEVGRLEVQEKEFDGLDDALDLCSEAERLLEEVERTRAELAEWSRRRVRLRELEREVKALAPVRALVFPSPEEGRALVTALADWVRFKGMASNLQRARAAVDQLGGMRGVALPTDEDTRRMSRSEEALGVLADLRSRLQTAIAAAAQATALRGRLADIRVPSPTVTLVEVEETARYHAIRRGLEGARTAVGALRAGSTADAAQLKHASREVELLRGSLGECPLCGRHHSEEP